MINISTIYKITNPKGKVYIGQTTNFEYRMSYYRLGKTKGQKKIHHSIQKYGWENHTVEILYSGPLSQEGLNQLEIHYVRIYNSFKGGLNLTEGGGGKKGYKPSPETKAKLSAALAGRPNPRKGKPLSQEHIAKREETRKERGIGRKQVSQYTKERVWIKDWPSIKEAGEALGIQKGKISTCAKGELKTSGGFIWKYSEE